MNHDALLVRLDYCGGRRGDGPDTNAWLEAATAIREQAKEIARLDSAWTALVAECDNHGKAYEGAVENALRLQRDNDALREQLAESRAHETLALWALNGGRYWLGSTIRRGVGERVTCHAKSIWSLPQIETVEGSEHADPWESLRLARAREK
jgi:hypothetical protein